MSIDRWDVVVVGAGNAALVAALAAHERGARVLVLEAAPFAERGGNSRFSGGIFRFPHGGLEELRDLIAPQPRDSRATVLPYTPDDFEADLVATSQGRVQRDLLGVLVDQANDCVRWMRDHGVVWELTVGKLVDPAKIAAGAEYAVSPGGAVRAQHEGVGLIENLFAAVEGAGIEVWYDSPVTELIMDGPSVSGVRVRQGSGVVEVLGQVILAAGGFEANPEMRARYLGPGWDLVKVRGTRFNSGTVLSLALRSGAQAAGHWAGCHASPLDAHAPDVGDLALTDKMSRYSYPYGLLVNTLGQRFIDEGEDHVWLTYAKTGAAILAQPRGVAFQIFDQRTVNLLEPRYSTGVPITGDSVAELAERLQIPAASLEATIEAFNRSVRPGTFDPFSKDGLSTVEGTTPPKSNWALPLDSPPFVAYAVTCGITFTYGGIQVDTGARVLDVSNNPIPGLYATGEITGGFFFHNYPGGSGLTRGAVFGRIAGYAAAEASA